MTSTSATRATGPIFGAWPELSVTLDEAALYSGLNFTLVTTAGEIDLLGEVPGKLCR